MHRVPYQDYRVDLEGLAAKAAEMNAPLVYLANPDNPTGTFHGRSAIETFLGAVPEDTIAVIDEAYADFAPKGELAPISDGAIVLRTFSKAHGMAGLRIGYMIADEEVITGLNRIRVQFQVSRIAQEAALASLDDPDFIQGVVAEVAKGREEYAALGSELKIPVLPSHTNFVSFDIADQERVKALILALEKEGVFVRTGPPPNNGLLRVSVGTSEQRALFAEAFKSVLARV